MLQGRRRLALARDWNHKRVLSRPITAQFPLPRSFHALRQLVTFSNLTSGWRKVRERHLWNSGLIHLPGVLQRSRGRVLITWWLPRGSRRSSGRVRNRGTRTSNSRNLMWGLLVFFVSAIIAIDSGCFFFGSLRIGSCFPPVGIQLCKSSERNSEI